MLFMVWSIGKDTRREDVGRCGWLFGVRPLMFDRVDMIVLVVVIKIDKI